MTLKHFVAALLGAVAIFLSSFLLHMFTPLGEAGMGYLPEADAVTSSLDRAIGDQRGMYMFPTGGLTAESSQEEKREGMDRVMEEMKTKPSGMLIYKPKGTEFSFGKSLAVEFLTDLAEALLAVLLLSQTALASYGSRVGFVTLLGVLAAIATNVSYWNWYGFPGVFTASNIFMEIIGFFFAGLVIAFILKPRRSSP